MSISIEIDRETLAKKSPAIAARSNPLAVVKSSNGKPHAKQRNRVWPTPSVQDVAVDANESVDGAGAMPVSTRKSQFFYKSMKISLHDGAILGNVTTVQKILQNA